MPEWGRGPKTTGGIMHPSIHITGAFTIAFVLPGMILRTRNHNALVFYPFFAQLRRKKGIFCCNTSSKEGNNEREQTGMLLL